MKPIARPLSIRSSRILSLLLLLTATAAAVGAEDLTLQASPNPAVVYRKVTLSVVVPSSNPETVSADFSETPAAIHVISGPYVQPVVDNTNPDEQTVKVSYVVEANEPGRVVIPALSISIDNAVRKTGPIVLTFGVLRGGKLVVPLQPVWTIPARKTEGVFYAGEAIPIVLELKNEARETTIDSVHLAGAPLGLEEVKEFASSSHRAVGETTLYQVPVASFILTAGAAGQVSLPSAIVNAGNRSGVSAPRELRIAPIPDAISQSGAIGAFSFRSWTTAREVVDGEEISLHLRIEGAGNLPRAVLPAPRVSGLLEIGKEETHRLSTGPAGYEGFREVIYRYLLQGGTPMASPPAASAGARGRGNAGSITVPGFAWLDPGNGVRSVSTKTVVVAARPASIPRAGTQGSLGTVFGTSEGTSNGVSVQPGGAGAGSAAIPFSLEPAAAIRGSEYRELYSNGDTYLWLLPGPLIFGLFLLLRPRRKSGGGLGVSLLFLLLLSCRAAPADGPVPAGVDAYKAGNLQQAAKDFAAARATYPRNAALSFNLGLVEYRLGRYGEAVHSVRTAVYYAPLSGKYRSALRWMIGRIGVPEQVPSAYPIHPDLFLVILIAGINAASILGILVLLKRSGGLAIALILVLVVSIISGGGLVYTAVKRSTETAVVKSPGTEMTKIPMAAAGRWLELPAGMAVRVRDAVNGYYLVETAYGNEGWVRQDRMLVDGK